MSYAILLINKNGIVITADTRLLRITKDPLPIKKSDHGKKLVFSEELRIAFFTVGAGAYINKEGKTIYVQSLLDQFIKKVAEPNSRYTAGTPLPFLIFTFLSNVVLDKILTKEDISAMKETYLTGIKLLDNGSESIDVDISRLADHLGKETKKSTINSLCQYKSYQLDNMEIITGGDHIFAWACGEGGLQGNQLTGFMQKMKTDLSNHSLQNLVSFAFKVMQTIINERGDPSIGGNIDMVTITPKGNFKSKIYNSPGLSAIEEDFADDSKAENNLSDDDSWITRLGFFGDQYANQIKASLSEDLDKGQINTVLEYCNLSNFKS